MDAQELLRPGPIALELASVVVLLAGIVAKSLRDRAVRAEGDHDALRERFDEYVEKRHAETVEMARRVEQVCGATTGALDEHEAVLGRVELEVRGLREEVRRCCDRAIDAIEARRTG